MTVDPISDAFACQHGLIRVASLDPVTRAKITPKKAKPKPKNTPQETVGQLEPVRYDLQQKLRNFHSWHLPESSYHTPSQSSKITHTS